MTEERHPNNPVASPQSLRSLLYDPTVPSLQVLDQLLLPHRKVYISIQNVTDAWSVIRSMQIRGAPLIAIVACLGLVIDLHSSAVQQEMASLEGSETHDETTPLLDYIQRKLDYLATSRPTAVNLFHALTELRQTLAATVADGHHNLAQRLTQATQTYAEFVLTRDEQDNRAIGKHGADCILKVYQSPGSQAPVVTDPPSQPGAPPQLCLMTICNTGSLATSHYGTALGVIRALHDRQALARVFCLETRPYNQGSRLTAFELREDGLPVTLICDSMSAWCMQQKTVHAVVVGADRVCANGDTANKVGTLTLSIVAKEHGVPFYVAAPFTTLDVSLAAGDCVEIEERPPKELVETSGAPEGMSVWNPGFDITPAKNIHGIITEKGVILRDESGKIDVAAFVKMHSTTASMETQKQDSLE